MRVAPPRGVAECSADLEALIKEARRHQRRRYLVTALVVAAVLGGAAGAAAGFAGPAGHPAHRPAAAGPAPRARAAAGTPAPRFFADATITGEGNGSLEVRASATGRLVFRDSRPLPARVLALAATGPGSFVVAEPGRGRCGTRLYRVRLSPQGLPGRLTRLGPPLRGSLISLAASAGGQVIAYTLDSCADGAPSYLGVFDTRTQRTREWALTGATPADSAGTGTLSESANGRLLAFTSSDVPRNWRPASGLRGCHQVVRVLLVSSAAGTVAERSRVLLSAPCSAPGLSAPTLSPSGALFYLLSRGRNHAAALTVASYATATGRLHKVIATLRSPGWSPVPTMALDPSGRYLLVPYSMTSGTRQQLDIARIDVSTRAAVPLRISLPDGGMNPQVGMTLAW